MATKLDISDLADVLAALTEVTKPYQFGIQLKIDSSILKIIERDYSKDIDRQKTEVVEHWLRNSPDASWTTLANAVERIGGHARLAETLRGKGQSVMGDTTKLQGEEEKLHSVLSHQTSFYQPSYSTTLPLDICTPHIILLLGKMGHGKSTLGNRILNSDGCFKINDQRCPQTTHGSSMLRSTSQLKDYKIEVYDHSGLLEGASSIDKLSSAVPEELDLVIFVLKRGCDFDESEVEILKSVVSEWQISRVSVLVLTHCERLSEEERGEMIEQFKKDHPSIAELMGKGILAVGFPDSSHFQTGSLLSQRVEEDKKKLRQLIYSCDEPIYIQRLCMSLDRDMSVSPPSTESTHQHPRNQQISHNPGGPDLQSLEFTYHQSQRRWLYFGVSVCIGCLCILCAYKMLKS